MKNQSFHLSCFRLLLFTMLLLNLSACKKQGKSRDSINPGFTEKIAAFTSGVISSESTIRIILTEDCPAAGEGNAPADAGLFKFKPAIKGQAFWVDKRTLEYRPSEPLKSGENYSARFKLGDIMNVKKELSVFEFSFAIVQQAWTVTDEGYQTHNENDLVWNRIKGTVNTADYIDNESIKKYFTANQESEKLKFVWEVGEDRRTFHFRIDSVQRKEEAGKVIIAWDASPDYKEIQGKYEVEIPALSDYKVLDVQVVQQPEQYIQIMLSDPVKKNQNFEGLIFLDQETSLDFSVAGNIIKAFPSSRQNGSCKITIREGLVNIMGYKLKSDCTFDLTFEVPKPAVRLIGKGVILPSSKGLVFPFEAVNLNAVDVKIIKIYENNIGHFLQVNRLDGSNELKRAGKLIHKQKVELGNVPADLGRWNRFYLDLAKLIEPDPGAIYRIEISFKRRYSLYPCEDQDAEEEAVEEESEDEPEAEASYWDSYEEYYDEYYYDYDWDYNWEERDNPCSKSYYTQNRWVARNILASDLGIIAKMGSDQTVFCAITSLVSSKPIKGTEVSVLNYQQQLISSGTTDDNGFVTLSCKEKPFLLIARYEKHKGYLRLDDGSSLSLGAFDVSGSAIPKGLKAFIYGERGVWRPGDTLFLSCILEDKQKVLPPMHPVLFELYNPKGQLYAKITKTSGVNGFYTWSVPTSPDALTGNWNLKVKVGGTQFNKTVKIETVKPNRLKINLTFDAKKLASNKPDTRGEMQVNWLHGAIAANLKTRVAVTLTEAPTSFAKYPAFQFTDPAKSFNMEEIELYEGYLDESGKTTIPGRFSVEQSAPGMLNANFTTRVFEKSGDFSIDRISIPYSPYSAYVGLKTPEGDKRGMLLTDTTHWVDVVLLDENGTALSRSNLEAFVYKLHWRNWWESAGDEIADYIGNTYNRPLVSKKLSTINGKGKFSFRINRPEWGRFYVRVVDPVSGHAAGKIIYIDWPGWAGRPMRDNPEAASMLTFNSDKEKYQVGEFAEIIVPTSGSGNALLSIENGSRIINTEWLVSNGKEIRHKFQITPDMAPNVYAHVTLVQPHASSENDMPMRLYGVIPVLVEDPQTRISPVLKMPDNLEPLQQFKVEVSEKSKREMTYTLAIVEEGLLDLTRFKTPDPWSLFYAREALGVRSWDLYDLVIGAYGGKLTSILGIGGDDEQVGGQSAEKANRFKPVVKYLGPFTLKAGKTNSHTLAMPNYIGSVRAMVVAGIDGAYGFTEKTVPVKKPLMVLATLPRVLGTGESVKLPVTVFAMDNQIKQVSVSVKTNAYLIAEGGTTQSLTFTQTGDKMVAFEFKTARKTGIGKVQVTATSGRNKAVYDIELDIRNANPPVTTYTGNTVDAGKTQEISFTLPGMESTNSAVLEVSGIPPIDAERRLRYLINYPHGCIEQITSTVFAQLYLTDLIELDENSKSDIEKNIKAGINKLQRFQVAGGGLAYWPGNLVPDPWGSSYAGHFLIEAEKKGYTLPAGMKSSWLKSQKQFARQWNPVQYRDDSYRQDDLEQAYRLYTLALAKEPEMAAMNRLREVKNLSVQAKWRLAAAYALAGQIQVAKELVSRETIEIQPYTGLYSSYGSRDRDLGMLLETMALMNNQTQGAILARRISESLSSASWMSTQTTAYCLLAVAKFTTGSTSDKLNFTYKLANGKTSSVSSSKPLTQVKLSLPGNAKTLPLTISNKGKAILFTRIIMEGIPESGEEKEFSNNLTVSVSYQTREGKPVDVSQVTQGTDFLAIVSVYNPGAFRYRQMALTQVFPPGWEIRNNRLADAVVSENISNPEYQDIRDDRIYTYFDLGRGERKTFVVQLNAAYLGKYYLPGIYCEAMYDNSISALKKGQWVEVVNAD
ncbi:MAG: hypothetical protein JXA72_01990 [Bacteroidales bacterium]|nr:hypothetical protein [Bacteroidales bacterium]